jgi:uncharacterized protein
LTEISRRRLLAALAAAGALPALGARAAAAGAVRYLSSVDDADGRHAFAGLDDGGRLVFRHALPDRGHGVTLHPRLPRALIVARRPGTFLHVVDLADGSEVAQVSSPEGRHFYGHAVYSADAALLYTTENAYLDGNGVIGIYDVAAGYARVGEFPCHGIGPHELRLMPDGRTLVVAIGGIRTHPDNDREPLNLATMQPSLAYIDAADGRLLHRASLEPALFQLSIRHMDVAADGRIALALQYEGPESDQVPVAGIQQADGAIRLFDAPAQVARRTRNYGGSTRFDASGRVLAVTCPRGNMALFWDLQEERFLGRVASFDGCGLGALPEPGRFVVASGVGGLALADALSPGGPAVSPAAGGDADALFWDNHLTLVAEGSGT